ncbi:MAG: 2-oxoacid ferredoxin oxidoreductase [Coriobacteriaceae bacterium]|nr:2-oxoacid ferredoxin oxidoreductase [Coriobacteriaceae bacterium]
MFTALKAALAELGWEKSGFAVFWGIGCHGNGADFYDVAGFHALHGRALPAATGFALTRPDMRTIVIAGDGDGYGLGLGHFVHSLRRNVEMTCITHNNQIYGLTTGQASPTTEHLMRTPSTPAGVLEEPVNPVGLALASGATFVARGFSGDVAHLTGLYTQALQHKGFALIDVFQPCVTWNKLNTHPWFRERVYKLEESGHDASDRQAAFELSMSTFHDMTCTPEECRVPIGVFFAEEGRPTYQDGLSQLDRPMWKHAQAPRDVAAMVEELG